MRLRSWPAIAVVCLWLSCGAVSVLAQDPHAAPSLTFFGWSDQHVQVSGDGAHLLPAIDAMNRLPGTAYPSSVGGVVEQPAFVFGCGDVTEWPTHAAVKTYETFVTERLKYPVYDVIGNHDEGGKSPSDTMKKWLIACHGAQTYTFEAQGVRFVALYSKYDENLNNPAQPLTRAALDELRAELAQGAQDQPTIVAMHLCLDALTNKDELVDVLTPFNILAVLSGHYHQATVQHYRGHHFVQLPSPAPGAPREVTVFRITPTRLVAIPYNYASQTWSTGESNVLDVVLGKRDAR